MRAADGSIVLVNRGFIPAEDRDRVARVAVPPSGATNTTAGGAISTGTDTAPDTPSDRASGRTDVVASTTVTGLLRMTEPRGAFLRHNDAAANHWYSRDVQAIAAARGLTHVAPYFVDAEAAPPSEVAPGDVPAGASSPVTGAPCRPGSTTANAVAHAACAAVPVAGLTVIAFHNSHLVYAITWYTLALMVGGAIWLGIRSEPRR
jgi:surfeit locus 1 family protein